MSEYSSKFLELIKPSKSFDDTKPPTKPDYSDIYNWAATPSIEGATGLSRTLTPPRPSMHLTDGPTLAHSLPPYAPAPI